MDAISRHSNFKLGKQETKMITKQTERVHLANVTLAQNTPSVAQTIDQVRAEMPGGLGASVQSGLPSTGIQTGAETVNQRAGSAGSNGSDPTHGGTESSFELNALNGGLSALLAREPLTPNDPTQRSH